MTVQLIKRQYSSDQEYKTVLSKNQPPNGKTAETGVRPGSSQSDRNGRKAADTQKASGSSTDRPAAGNSTAQPLVAQTRLASQASQIITVVASGSVAQVKLWEKKASGWIQTLSTSGHVGLKGVGPTHEGMNTTPYGAYSLGFAFGTENPGTSLLFRQITPRSWWVEDSKSPYYNSWMEGDSFNSPSEHLADYPVQYHYAIVINYNTARTPYAGSGFFVHCDNGGPTAGCVSIPTNQMKNLMLMLRPGAFIINVNSGQEIGNF
ncbi:L,D-transpeptidase family protein [Sporolactobacillus putidus]|uniref:YkuD domain-containing protein n=1 Tax=Sporolactobacillus putidus TaxID=492735 RepID=A0A917S4N9_9BACL|nr:hypothetical protein [Sporolactobacillus putidus]GGL58397.1 hypothetical protein GCM10007968_23010 [Sporolactobacillus putidus]